MTIRDDFIFEDDPRSPLSVGCPLEALAPAGSRDPEGADASLSETGVTPIAELKPVAELLRALSRTIKMARLYPDNNPIVMRAVEDLADRFTVAFQQHDSLRLLIGQNRIECQGEVIYENNNPDDSVARHFFRDGVREIGFHLGFDRREVVRFMDLYRRALSREEPEDLVTLLWDAALPHVTYVAIDEMLDADGDGEGLPEEFGADMANSIDFELDLMEPEGDGADSEAARQAAAAASEMQRKLRRAGDTRILEISPEEKRMLDAEVAGEDHARLARRVLDTLFEVLRLDAEPVARQSILPALEKALTSLAARRHFGPAAHILTRLAEATTREPELLVRHAEPIEAIRQSALELARLDLVLEILDRGTPSEQADLEEFLLGLPGDATDLLVDLLGRVTTPRAQRALVEALGRGGTDTATRLAARLDDSRSHVLIALLQILARLNDPSTVRAMRPLTLHADVRVRQEALGALTRMGEAEARQALVNALRDTDPRMRASAARTLGSLGAAGVNPLLQVVLARDFEGRRLDERRAFFDALGQTGSPEILPYLKHLLDKKPLFHKEKAEEMRVCVVEALARMTLPAALPLMEQALADPSPRVRGAAAAARRRPPGERGGKDGMHAA
jgi:HEAT repeat protein